MRLLALAGGKELFDYLGANVDERRLSRELRHVWPGFDDLKPDDRDRLVAACQFSFRLVYADFSPEQLQHHADIVRQPDTASFLKRLATTDDSESLIPHLQANQAELWLIANAFGGRFTGHGHLLELSDLKHLARGLYTYRQDPNIARECGDMAMYLWTPNAKNNFVQIFGRDPAEVWSRNPSTFIMLSTVVARMSERVPDPAARATVTAWLNQTFVNRGSPPTENDLQRLRLMSAILGQSPYGSQLRWFELDSTSEFCLAISGQQNNWSARVQTLTNSSLPVEERFKSLSDMDVMRALSSPQSADPAERKLATASRWPTNNLSPQSLPLFCHELRHPRVNSFLVAVGAEAKPDSNEMFRPFNAALLSGWQGRADNLNAVLKATEADYHDGRQTLLDLTSNQDDTLAAGLIAGFKSGKSPTMLAQVIQIMNAQPAHEVARRWAWAQLSAKGQQADYDVTRLSLMAWLTAPEAPDDKEILKGLKERDSIIAAVAGEDCAFTPALKKFIESNPGDSSQYVGTSLIVALGLRDEWEKLARARVPLKR